MCYSYLTRFLFLNAKEVSDLFDNGLDFYLSIGARRPHLHISYFYMNKR